MRKLGLYLPCYPSDIYVKLGQYIEDLFGGNVRSGSILSPAPSKSRLEAQATK
jgi:hypothetical protein